MAPTTPAPSEHPEAPAAQAPETSGPGRATPHVVRYAAFTSDPDGGNPAGVVLDASGLNASQALAVAADVGYSETAFLTAPPTDLQAPPGRGFTIRYFSPQAEVDFCGHATVATAVALAERAGPGDFVFATRVGVVPVHVDEALRATLTSVPTRLSPVSPADLTEALAALDWSHGELDAALPARIAFAGVNHLVVAGRDRERLAQLRYDFERLRTLMSDLDLTTLQLVWRESETVFHVRDPFPVGGVVEDPATGAAAAAFGGYVRELGLAGPGAVLTLHQGEDMGRPSLLTVTLPEDGSRVRVAGSATRIG